MKAELSIPVEDVFQLKGRGLVIPTHLPVLPNFRAFRKQVIAERPDRTKLKMEAFFTVDDFRLSDGSSRWVLVLEFSAASKGDIPVGSRILLDSQTSAIWSGPQTDNDR
jgi:hypothetical protein